jgi:serine/threonine protein kinase
MVHRDIKPANVLLESAPGAGKSYLTDFGLTKRGTSATQLTSTGQWVGTIDCVAPEQIQGGEIDARTDVYALGCMLYEALTGATPFAGDEMQKMWGHVNEPFPSPHGMRDQAPGLAAAIERATAKDPDDRFPSAGAFAAALPATQDPARKVTGRAPIPLRESPTTQMPSPPRRQRSAAGRDSKSPRTALTLAAAALIAADLLAAAIVVAGSQSSGDAPATTVIRGSKAQSTPAADASATSDTPTTATPAGEDRPGGSAFSAMLGAFSNERRKGLAAAGDRPRHRSGRPLQQRLQLAERRVLGRVLGRLRLPRGSRSQGPAGPGAGLPALLRETRLSLTATRRERRPRRRRAGTSAPGRQRRMGRSSRARRCRRCRR